MQLPYNFGKYELRELLAGQADVYRARDIATGRPVAVTFVASLSAAETIQQSIARVLDSGDLNGRAFVVTEIVAGKSVLDAAGRGLLPSLGLALQIAVTLDPLQRLGIAQPELRVQDVVLDASGKPRLTHPGMMDTRTWGSLLFALLTGGGGGQVDESRLSKAGVPGEIRTLVMRAAAPNASGRGLSYAEAVATLRDYLSKAEAAAAPPRPLISGRQPQSPTRSIVTLSVIVYAAVIVTMLLAIGTWIWMERHKTGYGAPPASSSYAKAMAEGMIDIPAGSFLAGPDKHTVALKEFLIDETEVTAGDFCDLMPCEKPPADRDLPIVNITIAQARLYAMRVGKRLPTPLEWERAARGANGKLFPWGDNQDPRLANVADNPSFSGSGLVHVKSFQAYPEYQMVGNAWEFVEGHATPADDAVSRFAGLALLKPAPAATEPWVAVRGGSYLQPLASALPYDSFSIPERYSAPDIGFRCVRDPH